MGYPQRLRPLQELWPPCGPSNETGCKVARLHNTCIYSVASHSWCQMTVFTQSFIMSSGILAPPQMQIWPPRWPPQTAAARNAPVITYHCRIGFRCGISHIIDK